MLDLLIDCPRCGGDALYIQEINRVKTGQCFSCGYQYSSLMTLDSQFLKEQIEILPEIYKILMSEDEEGIIWIPSFTNVEGKGMVYANGISRDNWWWEAVKYKQLEKPKTVKGKIISEQADMTSMKKFKEQEFLDALEYIRLL